VDDQLLSTLSNDHSSVSPREVVHRPERVEREVEGEDGDGEDVEEHPSDHVPLPSEEEDHDLETVDCADHDEGEGRNRLSLGGDEVDEVDELEGKRRKAKSDRLLLPYEENREEHSRRRQSQEQ